MASGIWYNVLIINITKIIKYNEKKTFIEEL